MMRLSMGSYQPGNSIIHGLNQPTKLIGFILSLCAVVGARGFAGCCAAGIFAAGIFYISQGKLAPLWESVKSCAPLLIFIILVNTAFAPSASPWLRLWIFAPSLEGLMVGIRICAKSLMVIVLGRVLISVATPLNLAKGIEWLIYPLKFIKVNVRQGALILTMAIEFIPMLFARAKSVLQAQKARGETFKGGYFEKAALIEPLFIPIFSSLMEKADTLSRAMEAYGYDMDDKTPEKISVKFTPYDISALVVCAGMVGLSVFVF